MPELRVEFHRRLSALEDELLGMGEDVLTMLDTAMVALANGDVDAAATLAEADDRLDERYRAFAEEVLTVLTLESPVASELRLLVAFIHCSSHLERMGDLCENIGNAARLVADAPADPELRAQLAEMGVHANRVITRALEALARRDLDLVATLDTLDEPLDRLNRGLFTRLVQLAAEDEEHLDWAMRMVLVARFFERLGDHAVDIGAQTRFIVTGQADTPS
ncbi:MAG TPA: phosphate signaling complex protein PhoU [Egibacteraceae bacterium]